MISFPSRISNSFTATKLLQKNQNLKTMEKCGSLQYLRDRVNKKLLLKIFLLTSDISLV